MATAPLAVLVPILAATVLAGASPVARRPVAIAVALVATAALVVLAAVTLARAAGGTLVTWFGGWEPRHGVALGVDFAVDPIGGGFAVFVGALGLVALVTAVDLIHAEDHLFAAVMLVFLAAMAGFCLSGDLFNLFVFFELMSVCAYVLVGYETGQDAPLQGSLTFAITNSIGSILLLFGIGLLYGRTGALNLAQMGQALATGPLDGLVVVAYALVAGGLLVKAAAVPFHFWTADAYAVAPTPVMLLLSGAFAELGLFGLARVHWTVFAPVLAGHAGGVRAVLVGAGVLTAVLGAVMCPAQHHLKRLLAFSTIAQVGLFLIGLGLLSADGVAAVAVFVVGDGLVKAALFTAVGILHHRCGSVEERDLHGRARDLAPLGALVVLGALAVATLPPFGPFLGKAMLEDAALKAPGCGWLPPVMVVVSALTGGTLLRVSVRTFAGVGVRAPEDRREEGGRGEPGDEQPEEPGALSPLLWGPVVLLLAASLAWGLLPGLPEAAGRAAERFVDSAGYASTVLHGTPSRPPETHAHGPTATGYLYAAGSVLGALLVAALPLLGVWGRGPVAGQRVLAVLRDLHDGRPGDYATWTALGVALLGALLALAVG